MASSSSVSPTLTSLVLVVIVLLSTTSIHSLSNPRASEAGLICSPLRALPADRETFNASFAAAMEAVTPWPASLVVKGRSGRDAVIAFGECMRDLSDEECELCFKRCKNWILECGAVENGTRGGQSFLDGCYLRYDDHDFLGEAMRTDDRIKCSHKNFSGNQTAFSANTGELVKKLSSEAPNHNGFRVASVEKGNVNVYGLAQCWQFMNQSSCHKCLLDASMRIGSCTRKDEGRVLNSGCYMRYSTYRFYNSAAIDGEGDEGGDNLDVVLAVASSCGMAVIIVTLIVFFAWWEFSIRKEDRSVREKLGASATAVYKSGLNFKYETLERATHYFSNSNKLGQGGSGSVFKGVLTNGKTVAVKRLFFNTRQWIDHFFNEVNIISGINHKNLVKLLGCSITGPESLLVYEYLPNKSLSYYFYDSTRSQILNWEKRYNIILGAAEGLAYLHEESQSRIIHRDIKLSNVLLDENYTAKIADFGLVRLLPEDKTHITTGIAGTVGYLAPEYLIQGILTEKVDVFSFGVLAIEVVTGRRNNSRAEEPLSVLQMVWNLYKSGKLSEAVDPVLESRFPVENASRVLHIGLLCAQLSPDLRPSMSRVVKMLKDGNDALPQPQKPPLLACSTEMSLEERGMPNLQHGSSILYSRNSAGFSELEPR